MRGVIVTVISVLLLLSTVVAAPPPSAQNGLQKACSQASSPQPCTLLGDVIVGPGESQTYSNGTYVANTIVVQTGGTLTVDDATLRFNAAGEGILVHPGGALRIYDSILEPRQGSAIYRLDLAAGSEFVLNQSTVRGGTGVKLATSDADVAGNSFETIPLALFLDNVVVTIHHNQFIDNDVAVNETGGITTLDHNLFQGGTTCVRNWLADPTITNNTFRGCHTGILHQRSNSVFRANDMEDQVVPPGTGIIVQDTNSPVIEGNLIARYGTGIKVINATAYIRNNTIRENVGDGVYVERNTQPMDITGNDIHSNGGDGIELNDTEDVALANNSVHDNGGDGIAVHGASGTTLSGDVAAGNALHGFRFTDTAIVADDITASGNGLNGVYVVGDADHLISTANASGNGHDGFRIATNAGAQVDLLAPIAIGNVAAGLRGMNGTVAQNGWWESNGDAGVENVDLDWILPAECGYWGSANGPTVDGNEGGDGDEAVGNVGWSPFRTSPTPPSCGTILLITDG